MRRLPLLLLLVLLPVPAQADQHNMAASAGLSIASLAVRLGFEVRLVGTAYEPPSVPQRRAEPAEGDRKKPRKGKESLFLIAEADKFVDGKDSGHARDGGMIGLRGFIGGPSRVEPFFHLMGGLHRPSRRNVTAGDDDWSGAAAAGGGVDIELHPSDTTARVLPVLRLQFDLVESGVTPGFDPYGRATFGVSLRIE